MHFSSMSAAASFELIDTFMRTMSAVILRPRLVEVIQGGRVTPSARVMAGQSEADTTAEQIGSSPVTSLCQEVKMHSPTTESGLSSRTKIRSSVRVSWRGLPELLRPGPTGGGA